MMDIELSKKLWTKYPEIFSTDDEGWGLGMEHSDGWYQLIDDLCGEIMQFCKAYNQEPPVAVQIKEKFGGLRFYIGGAPEEVHDIISKYENKSYHVCELCGEFGRVREIRGWLSCLCEEHYNERKEKSGRQGVG